MATSDINTKALNCLACNVLDTDGREPNDDLQLAATAAFVLIAHVHSASAGAQLPDERRDHH